MMNKKLLKIPAIIIAIFLLAGCKKFLDKKSDKELVIPVTIQDFQALMDNYGRVNLSGSSAGESSSDDYYLTYDVWSNLSDDGYRQLYIWGDESLFDGFPNDWSKPYDVVYIANTVLEGLSKIEKTNLNRHEWEHAKGQALFLRSNAFLQVLSIWCQAYEPSTAGSELGIPLRLHTDFNEGSTRASLENSYQQVISDLRQSIPLLPDLPVHPYRSSKTAAYGVLSRACLWMRDYPNAGKYADSSLALQNELIDFNTLNASATYPLPFMNKEVVFYYSASVTSNLINSRARIDSVLYDLYEPDDLRKTIYFKNNNNGSFGFKGSHTNSSSLFVGFAVDEAYITSAEAHARAGNITKAMNILNALLEKRWNTGTFIPFTASTPQEALAIILKERRKELLMRGLRWMDIKRLNKEGASIELKRELNNQTYILPPNDPRFALPIPEDVINLSGMQQNPR